MKYIFKDPDQDIGEFPSSGNITNDKEEDRIDEFPSSSDKVQQVMILSIVVFWSYDSSVTVYCLGYFFDLSVSYFSFIW